jgi:hypothetical protein
MKRNEFYPRMKSGFALLFLLSLTCISTGRTYAQNLPVYPSAESTGLVRSIQHPVNHTSGLLNIQVPLYNIEYNGINVPIAVNYHASGIKVEDRPGILGMGWRLIAGGKITRVVRQYPDDRSPKPYMWGKTSQYVCKALYNFDNIISNCRYYVSWDTEPDLFFFEISGRSGMFVLDASGVPRTIPYQNITIEPQWENSKLSHFIIKDEQGAVYTFGNSDASRESTKAVNKNSNIISNGGEETLNYVSTWHLNSIESYTGSRVEFSYTNGVNQSFESIRYSHLGTRSRNIWNFDTEEARMSTTISAKFPSSISWGNERIDFSYAQITPSRLLEMVYSYRDQNNVPIKSTRFSYQSLQYQRFQLGAIRDYFSNSTSALVAKFEYNTTSLPAYDSKDYDHWGYYNGKNNTTHRPSYGGYIGANRSPSLSHTKAGILTAIGYPTGGKTEYEYELNRYLYEDNEENAGGLRIKEIRQRNGSDVQSTKYKYLINNKSSGTRRCDLIFGYSVFSGTSSTPVISLRPDDNPYDIVVYSRPTNDLYGIEGQYVTYSCVTEIHPDNSKTRYCYTKSDSSGDIYSDLSASTWEYSGGKVSLNTSDSELDAISGIQPTSRFWRRGLLSTIERFDAVNNLIEKQIYTYELQLANRSEVRAYIPYSPPNPFVDRSRLMCEYKWESQPVYLKKIENVATAYNPASTTMFTYNTEYMVPTQTEQTDAEGNRIKTIVKYPFNYPNTSTSSSTYGLHLLRQNRIITPVETIVYRNNKVIGANIHVFTTKTIDSKLKTLPWKQYVLPIQTPLSSLAASTASSSSFTFDSRYELQNTNTDFDLSGRVLTSETPTGERKTVVYSGVQPIATITNARVNQVFHTSFENESNGITPFSGTAKTGQKVYNRSYSINLGNLSSGTYLLTYWKSTNSGTSWQKVTETLTISSSSPTIKSIGGNYYIDEVRIHPVDARMNTYTYITGVGKSSEMDHNGKVIYYQYLPNGRLQRVSDQNGYILEQYDYHYVSN